VFDFIFSEAGVWVRLQCETLIIMRERNTVKFKLEEKMLQPVTLLQRERLAALAAMPDAKIDYSDIPKQTRAVQWTRPGASMPTLRKLPKK